MKKTKTLITMALAVAGWGLCHAQETKEERYAPAKYYRVPREFGVISSYDSVIATDDGKVIMGGSTYTHPANLIELDLETGEIIKLGDVGKVIPQDDLHFITQSKIHTIFEFDSEGVLYFGTHTGEPDGSYEDPRLLLGGHFMSYNAKTGEMKDYGIARPRESLMRVALDEKRGKLYGMGYPRGHFMVCDYRNGGIEDLGKASLASYSNPWLMHDGNVYFNTRYDELSRFDPDDNSFETLPVKLPDIDGEKQALTFRSWLLRSDDRKRLYGIVEPAMQVVEWDISNPPGKVKVLGGDISVHSMIFNAEETKLYLPGWNGELFKYDMESGKFYNLGFLRDGDTVIGSAYGACRAPDGRIVFTGYARDQDGKVGAGYGRIGFWVFDPADEEEIQKEVWGADAPPQPKKARVWGQRNGQVVAFLNDAIPYGESSVRAMTMLPNGSSLVATTGTQAHIALVGTNGSVRTLCKLPSGEHPAFGGFVRDKDGNLYLGTCGDLETVYSMKNAPDGRVYRVELNTELTKASLKEIARPFKDDGVYTMAVNPAGTGIFGVTFPGARFFSMSFADGKAHEHLTLATDARPQNEDSNRYNWMQIPLGRQIAFGADGTAFAGANGTTLYGVNVEKGIVTTNNLLSLWKGQIDALVSGPDGKLYGGTDRGFLFRFDPATGAAANLGKPLRQARMRSLCFNGDALYGICGEEYGASHLFRYTSDAGYTYPAVPGPYIFGGEFANDHYEVLLPGQHGGLWLGGSGRMSFVVRMVP